MPNNEFASYTLTDAGSAIMARVLLGENITFKRIAVGDGYDYDITNFKARTSLVNEVISLTNLSMKIVSQKAVSITGQFDSEDLSRSFYNREVGLYIVDPEDEDNEILYAYGNNNDNAEYITPHIDSYVILKEFELLTLVGESTNVHVIINDDGGANVIDFVESDWTLDSSTGMYILNLGDIRESLKVFKTDAAGKTNVPGCDIKRTLKNSTILRSLISFDGCVVAL